MSPPTMAMPRGRRSSEPTPRPRASGSAPRSAAHLGHNDRGKRQEPGWVDGIPGVLALPGFGLQVEVDNLDPVLLTIADKEVDAVNPIAPHSPPEAHQRTVRPT